MSKTPAKVWQQMVRGNERFVAGEPSHPRQDVERRTELANSQAPDAALFGCSDSRLAAEIIFDKGLGDLFVVRNAGQIVSASAVASLEYAVAVLEVPLIVVLAHDRCGAVKAAIDLQGADAAPLPPHIASHIAPIRPAVTSATRPDEQVDPAEVGRLHLRNTVRGIVEASELISDAVAEGRLAIVGANYRLSEGRAEPDLVIGSV
jgi:carbonic anhydrase